VTDSTPSYVTTD